MKKKNAVIVAILLVLLAGVGWALFSGDDAAFVEAKQRRDEIFQKLDTLSSEERRAEFQSLRKLTENLSEDQRRALWGSGRQYMMQRVDQLLALPPAERKQELDKMIDQIEKWRKDSAGNRGGRGGDRQAEWENRTEAERDQRRKERLDRTSPEMRAKMDLMRDMMNQRRKERGMEPMQGGGGWR
jgi:hypothetical protein